VDWEQIIIVVAAGLLGAVPGILARRTEKHKREAETQQTLAETHVSQVDAAGRVTSSALEVMESLKERIEELEAAQEVFRTRVTELEIANRRVNLRNLKLIEGVRVLTNQLARNGEVPEWTPCPELLELMEPI